MNEGADNRQIAPPCSPSIARIAVFCLLFTTAMLAAFPAFAWYGQQRFGAAGLNAAAVAGSLCWISAGAALTLLGLAARRGKVLIGVLVGMGLRMGPPLAACFLFVGEESELARAGVGGMILLYYLIALAAETLLSVKLVSGGKPQGEKTTGQGAATTSF